MKTYKVSAAAVVLLARVVDEEMERLDLKETWNIEVTAEGGSRVQLETDHDWPLRCAIWLFQR